MKKNLLLCLIILIIIRNIMTREEFKAEMAEKKERAEARINSALQMFADMIIDRMEVIEASNWKQGWTDGEAMIGLPQNVTSRVYTGSNAFLCQLHSMKNNYKVPVYLTFPQLKDLGAFPKKGEKSIPIFKWGFSIHNRETGEKATLEEYDSIPKEERDKKYKVIPYLKIFNEWNIDQTNLEEVNKEKYDALLSKFEAKEIKDDNGMYSNAAIDQMLASQSWVCPIEYTQQNPSALYNKSKDVIIVPRKDQFNISDTPEEIYKDGEEYYSSLIHEMAHSTGHESRLNRLSPGGKFGGEEYAKEELVAELTAAMVGSALGFDSRIRDNNTAYLKSWMSALKKEPKFLLSVMSDVNKASAMVIEHIDEERVKLGEKALLDGNLDGEEEREKNEKEMQKIVNDATQEKESFSAFRESRTFQVLKGIIISAEWNTGNPLHNVSNFQDFKKAFASVTDIDKFEPSYPKADEKDLTLLKTQVAAMSQKELLEAGAYMLPYYHYPHKEGRTLEDIRQSFRRIEKIGKANPGNEQIQKRVEQARSIYNRYEQNVMDQYKSYEISEDEMKIPSIPMPRYTYIEGLPQLEARQQIQKEFNSLESYMKAISLKSGEVSVRYNIDNNMLEAWREVDANLEAINESLQENEEYQAIEEDEEEAESLDEDNQVKVPREDSNIETDVAGMAKQFVAEGMSMEEAEQKAKSIVEEQQHQEYYDEEKQKDAEQKQQQKKQEEQAKKEEEKKPVNHAALLFAALGLASEKNGVWMNRAQRQPAEFIHSHTPVTAYNSIMMTLNTDANKYKTNVYTFYKSAAENNLPVKRNEESLKFNWLNWDYQNMMNHDDIITQKKYDALSDEEKSFYAKHASRVEQHIYNVDQTIMNAKDHEAYGNLVKTKGAPFVKAEERTISVLQQYNDYQKKHPDVVVLKKTGDSYEIYGEKASDVAKILNLEIEKKKMDGKKVDLVSFPSQHLDTYLPKIIRAGNRVSINDNLKEKKVSIPVQDNTAILNKAYSTAKAVADQSGMKYERIMVVQDTKYDKVDDKIVVSGMSEKTADENHATLYKANDIYRAVVAAVGSEERLDRSGRNSFLPEDDAKHEKLVQELAAGVLMTRQGLPAILSKESEKLVPYWQRELTENPKMLGVLERDVNNAVETIDSILAKREVDYKAIRGQMPGKILTENPERFSISSSLAKLPSMETKEMVVVLDKKHKTADVILPAGASLQVNNEVPGMSKKRILTALGKMEVKEVSFYNAGGGLSLHESNDYYKGKEVTVSKLKQYELLTQQTVDLKDKFAPKKEVKITTFEALPDDMGRYAFFIKAENEPAFAVYPNKEHVNQFYSSLKSENRAVVHNALAKKYYELGTKHPDARVDVITPRKVNIGDAKIDRICITAKRNDPKQHIIFATVNGERMHAPVSKAQWNKMWLSEDMSDYKQRLAAVIFEPFIKKEVKNDVNQQASEEKDETVKPDSPAPEKEQEEQVEQTSRKGRGIH